MGKLFGTGFVAFVLIIVLAIVGEVKCVVKFISCDFEPKYKAEVIYGIGTFTGLGCIIGWVDIEDGPAKQ